jgi:hypothetical protein
VLVDVVARGDREAVTLVDRLAGRIGGGRALTGLIDEILAFQAERFHGKGARWRKLAPATIREHAHHGRGAQPLVLTGALMRSLSERGAPGQFIEIRANQLRLGTRIYYARFHKRGQGVPRRVPAGLTRDQRVEIVNRFRQLLLS